MRRGRSSRATSTGSRPTMWARRVSLADQARPVTPVTSMRRPTTLASLGNQLDLGGLPKTLNASAGRHRGMVLTA